MKIALVTNLYPPIQTGTAYYTQALAHAMVRRGHDVMVVTCRAGGETIAALDGGVRIVRLPALRLPPNRGMLNFDDFKIAARPGFVGRLTHVLAGHAPDVVHQCGHLLDLTYATPRAARELSVPAACSVHAMIHLPGRPVLDGLARGTDRTAVASLAMRRYDAILSLDRTIERYVTERHRAQNVIGVPYGIDFDYERHERKPRNGGPLRIVSLGHVTEMRSRVELLRALAHLREGGVEAELRIIGKECTPIPRELSESLGIADAVTFTGELPRENALEELTAADVQANWITNPGVGSAGMESMAMGIPTLLWAAPDELPFAALEHLGNAVLVDPSDERGIADVLARLAGDRDLLDQIGANARATAREHFGWDTTGERMEAVYEGLASVRAAS